MRPDWRLQVPWTIKRVTWLVAFWRVIDLEAVIEYLDFWIWLDGSGAVGLECFEAFGCGGWFVAEEFGLAGYLVRRGRGLLLDL